MVDAPTLDEITGHTVMTKMRELVKQMTQFAKEVADLVNSIPASVEDVYNKETIDGMIEDIDSAINTLSDSVYSKSETDALIVDKQDKLVAGRNIEIEGNTISAYYELSNTILVEGQYEVIDTDVATGIRLTNGEDGDIVNIRIAMYTFEFELTKDSQTFDTIFIGTSTNPNNHINIMQAQATPVTVDNVTTWTIYIDNISITDFGTSTYTRHHGITENNSSVKLIRGV